MIEARKTIYGCFYFSLLIFSTSLSAQSDIFTFSQDNAKIRDISFSSNNKYLLVQSGDAAAINTGGIITLPSIHVWDTEGKNKIFTFSDKQLAKGACFSTDGNYVAYREKGNINVMDIATRKTVSVIKIYDNKITHPSSFLSGNKILMVQQGSAMAAYDITVPVGRLENEFQADGVNHYFTRDDSYVVESYADNFKLLDLKTGREKGFFGNQKDLKNIIISQDNRFIAALNDNNIKLWDSKSVKLLNNPIVIHEKESIYCFSPDGRYVLGGLDTLKFWELKTGKELVTPIISEGKITKAAFSNDGKFVAVGDSKGVIRLWNMNEETMADIYFGHEIETESRLISQKREFEKTDEFLKRKQKLLRSIRSKYLNQYLEKIGSEKTLQDQWQDEDEKREEDRKLAIRASRQAVTLHIDSLGVYNADKETFSVHVVGDSDTPFNRWEEVRIPLRDNAPCFKQKYATLIVSALKQTAENLKSVEVFNIKIKSNCAGRDKDYSFGPQRVLTEE